MDDITRQLQKLCSDSYDSGARNVKEALVQAVEVLLNTHPETSARDILFVIKNCEVGDTPAPPTK
jgi:hypothetical protein